MRHYRSGEPFQRHCVRGVTEAAQEEHGIRFSRRRRHLVSRRIDSRAQPLLQLAADARQKRCQVLLVLQRADLHTVAMRQHAQLVVNRPHIFEARRQPFESTAHVLESAPDRLEVDVVLEQDAGDAAVFAGVLAERRVFELQDIHLAREDLAVNAPGQIVVLKLAHRVRNNRAQIARAALHTAQEFCGLAEFVESLVRVQLIGTIEQDDRVDVGDPRQFPQRLVHEDAAAVSRRTDRIRRDKQHAQPARLDFERIEAVAEIAAQRSPKRLRIIHDGQRAGR